MSLRRACNHRPRDEGILLQLLREGLDSGRKKLWKVSHGNEFFGLKWIPGYPIFFIVDNGSHNSRVSCAKDRR